MSEISKSDIDPRRLVLVSKSSVSTHIPKATPPQAKHIDLLTYPLTDTGNAERLIATFCHDVRYCPNYKSWMVWDGKRWKRDIDGRLSRMARETARRLYAQAATIKEKDEAAKVSSFARRSENAAGIRAMLECAQSIEGVYVSGDYLDANPWKLNCLNGTLDLATGELEEHDRFDLITKMCPVRFDKNAQCPRFRQFLQRIFDGKEELTGYIQRILGYALTGDVGEKGVFCLVGNGNNGKTTLLEILRHVLGDYSGQILIDSLMQKENTRSSAALADLADLKGKRFVTTSEAEEGSKLAEAQVKQITGMGMYKACRKYENPIEFSPTWKIFMDTNHKPAVRGKDAGIWNRLKLIRFDVEIPSAEIDKKLLTKLKKEAPGILSWALEGCLKWQQDGLQEPNAVKEAIFRWRNDSDPFRGFFGTLCEFGPGFTCSGSTLLKAFRAFKRSADLDVAEAQFTAELKRRGCTQYRNKKARHWRGIRIRSGDG
jgi:putative DNA primase/helicase